MTPKKYVILARLLVQLARELALLVEALR